MIKAYGEGVPRKILEKKYLGTSNFADFAREISKIRSKNRFYLETTNFGKKIDKIEREFSWRSFFLENSLMLARKGGNQSGKLWWKHFSFFFFFI